MRPLKLFLSSVILSAAFILLFGCNDEQASAKEEANADTTGKKEKEYLSEPLVSHMYTADPSAHFFNGRIYIYPSHENLLLHR